MGSTSIKIFDTPHQFYIVPDNFLITQEGILESTFLHQGAIISHRDNSLTCESANAPFLKSILPVPQITVPKRTVARITVHVRGPIYGYLQRLEVLFREVSILDGLVTNNYGSAYTLCANFTEEDASFPEPAIEIEEVDKVSTRNLAMIPRSCLTALRQCHIQN